MNPARTKQSKYSPARVTVAVLVHIPHLTGFYEHRLRVFQACLDSIVLNTTVPYDLMVFDNASCPEVRLFIREMEEKDLVQFVYRSGVNTGKLAALRLIFAAAPGELVAFSDDDVHHYPGWLAAELEVYDTFPKVGMVSGYVTPSMFVEERIQAALGFARSDPEATLTTGAVVPSSMTISWATSTSRDPELELEEQEKFDQYLIAYRGVEVLAAANHDQFLSSNEAMEPSFPRSWDGRLMGGMIEMDRAMDQGGFLRLSTFEQHTQNLGNRFVARDLVLSEEAQTPSQPAAKAGAGVGRRLLKLPPVRFVLLGIYSRMFHWVHPK